MQQKPAPRLLPFALAALTVLAAIVLGHDDHRVAQQMALALPGLVWLAWARGWAGWHRAAAVLVWLWAATFVLDGIVRGHLLDVYQAAPDGSMVIGALPNTSVSESAEYLAMHWRSIAVSAAWLVGAAVLLAWAVRPLASGGAATPIEADATRAMAPRRMVVTALTVALSFTLSVALFVSAVGYASRPWRSTHPWIFWSGWSQSVKAQRASWNDQVGARQTLLDRARAAPPGLVDDNPANVMLVISDSINRDNLALYGYGRSTTPGLLRARATLGDALVVFRNAWSVDASTLPALRNFFRFGIDDAQSPQHLIAVARAAGYRVWWIGNQDDLGIEQLHARLADEVRLVNRTPGRSSSSPDTAVIDSARAALADPSPRKLIVVHLMGAHPHYRHRFAPDANPFDDHVDAVETSLLSAGRPRWLREKRGEYDAALLQQDAVVSELLGMTTRSGAPDDRSAWMYFSDHGQEVAHETNHAGHSASTAAGYRIPALIWQRHARHTPSSDLAMRPFRADWAAWTAIDLLGIRPRDNDSARNVLDAGYVWQAPTLPVPVKSFTD